MLGKALEHLTHNQSERLKLITETDKVWFRTYRMKESLRLLLKIKDVKTAEKELKHWRFWASHSRIKSFIELYKKSRHKQHILNTIRLGFSNARVKSTHNKIKLITLTAYGFRSMKNMQLDMILLKCSDIQIPLPNRTKIA